MLRTIELHDNSERFVDKINLHLTVPIERDWHADVQLETAFSLGKSFKTPIQKSFARAACSFHTSRFRQCRFNCANKKIRQWSIHTVPNEPPYGGGIVSLPFGVRRKYYVCGPTRNSARR